MTGWALFAGALAMVTVLMVWADVAVERDRQRQVSRDAAIRKQQTDMLAEVARRVSAGTAGPADEAALLAIGPIRGSFGDMRGGPAGGCRHLAYYPGCRGGCARRRING